MQVLALTLLITLRAIAEMWGLRSYLMSRYSNWESTYSIINWSSMESVYGCKLDVGVLGFRDFWFPRHENWAVNRYMSDKYRRSERCVWSFKLHEKRWYSVPCYRLSARLWDVIFHIYSSAKSSGNVNRPEDVNLPHDFLSQWVYYESKNLSHSHISPREYTRSLIKRTNPLFKAAENLKIWKIIIMLRIKNTNESKTWHIFSSYPVGLDLSIVLTIELQKLSTLYAKTMRDLWGPWRFATQAKISKVKAIALNPNMNWAILCRFLDLEDRRGDNGI
jgi:hypothetical protein